MTYREFFAKATGGREPFRFQERFRLDGSSHTILSAPTGLGKTATVLVSWLHRLVSEPGSTTRRLVWCLPGRALTEQVASEADKYLHRLGGQIGAVRVCRLLGGSADNDLTLTPDQPAVLVGTQDILLSRALNRGYARHPFRWPIDFALLANDCEWVFDEVQLLGDGLATSTQLAAFRRAFGCFGPTATRWISATFDPKWLATVDFSSLAADLQVFKPEGEDLLNDIVKQRLHAEKRVERAPLECRIPTGVADLLAAQHQPGALSLAVCNTVARAVEIRAALSRKSKADVLLLHSRFRAADRARHVARLTSALPPEGRIVIATQVIEAGIDIDATLLVSDIAPYSSMVQRFGRVNRYGERAGQIYWVDRPLTAKRKNLAQASELKPKEQESICLPYEVAEVEEAIKALDAMVSAAPGDLPPVASQPPWEHVLRRTDILDLFDTSSDLGGNEIDISRFVRSGQDRDVYVAWRDWEDGGKGVAPRPDMAEIDESELCPAPIGDVKDIASGSLWQWNSLTSQWVRPAAIYPGLTLLMHVSGGRYTNELGWCSDSREPVIPLEHKGDSSEGLDSERKSFVTYRRSLAGHTEDVCEEMQHLLNELAGLGLEPYRAELESAARFHDWGKAHPVMQKTLHNCDGPYAELLGKQERGKGAKSHSRRFFRHELASALAMLDAGETDLAAYISAAHHGRVRVSIRSMPGEREGYSDRIRGIQEDDRLLACSLAGGIERPETVLSRTLVRLGSEDNGQRSWTDRAMRLRDTLGPFRLAYLEMLLRAADERGSEKGALAGK